MEGFPYKIILASSSPRRRDLINLLEIPVQFVIPKYKEESPVKDESPGLYAVRMAESKVLSSSQDQANGTIIIGSDTVVSIGSIILGKPRNANQAEHMLRLLRNKEHAIHTALSVLWKGEHELASTHILSKVNMRDYSDEEIAQYIASGDPFDKAGSYAVQNAQFDPVRHLDGCYTSAIGLSLCYLVEMLENIGVELTDFQYEKHAALFSKCTDCVFLNSMCVSKSSGPI